MSKQIYIIDGNKFSTLEEFWEEIGHVLMGIPNAYWGRNLDAFNDILYGGWGTPDEGFILIWKNSSLSRTKLGYPETVRQLERRLKICHPVNREHVKRGIESAGRNEGQTVFDWLVEIIREHKDIELMLE